MNSSLARVSMGMASIVKLSVGLIITQHPLSLQPNLGIQSDLFSRTHMDV